MPQHDSSPRSITFTASANLLDANAIKTSIATQATAFSYSGAALDGAAVGADHIARPVPNSHTGLAQYPVVTASAAAGSYVNGSTITFTGTYGGEAATSVATVVGTDGAAAFIGSSPLETVSAVAGEAQANAGGQFEFGFTDLAARKYLNKVVPWQELRGYAAGAIACVYSGGEDLLPVAEGEHHDVKPIRIRQATTTVGFTLYE